MAAPVKMSGGKIVFQKSHFDHPTTQHLKCMTDHWFNAAVDITLPDSRSIPAIGLLDNIEHAMNSERYCCLMEVPVSTLIREEFVEGFVRRGQVSLLSRGTKIDEDDCLCILPTGQMILHVGKDTYEKLGLEGKQSAYNGLKKIVTYELVIDLAAPHFRPGKKGYERIKTRLDIWNKSFDVLVQWKPENDDVCPSSLPTYLAQFSKSRLEKRAHKRTELKFPDSLVPVISPDKFTEDDDEDHVTWEEFYDWLGCRACGVVAEGRAGDYVNTYFTPEPNSQTSCLSVHRFSGFISSAVIVNVFDQLREHLESSQVPWLALTVHGYPDSPVSWKRKEHGYLKQGDNFYTFILFPDKSYWLIQGVGTFDVCP